MPFDTAFFVEPLIKSVILVLGLTLGFAYLTLFERRVLARLQVRYPEVQVVFADSRKFAEEWTYRFLAAALGEAP